MKDAKAPPEPATPAPPAAEGGFDQRLERLEGIVSELEGGELGLEPAIERYQEGIELLKSCHAQLASYRRRVEELTADAERSLKPYGKDPDGEPEAGA